MTEPISETFKWQLSVAVSERDWQRVEELFNEYGKELELSNGT